MKKLELHISGMHCDGCAGRIARKLQSLPGVKTATVDLKGSSAAVSFDEKAITDTDIKSAIQTMGYDLK